MDEGQCGTVAASRTEIAHPAKETAMSRNMTRGQKQSELGAILHRWMARNRIRVALWTVQWSAMATWFGLKVTL
jgi:hypothetical protein